MLVRFTIGILSFAGLLSSSYFAAVYHRWTPDAGRFVPKFCRMEQGECLTLLETRQARVFGVPNFDQGILFYVSLVVAAVLPDVWLQLRTMLFFGATVAVLTGFYLTYVLLVRLKVPCALCFISHVINLLLLLCILVNP